MSDLAPLRCRHSLREVGNTWTTVIRSCGVGGGNGPILSSWTPMALNLQRSQVPEALLRLWPNREVRSNILSVWIYLY